MGMFKEKEGIQSELETLKILGRWREDLWEKRKGFGVKKKMRIGILRVNPIMEEDGEREREKVKAIIKETSSLPPLSL